MQFILLAIFALAVIYFPQWWAKRTFARYHRYDATIPTTGGELAKQLLQQYKVEGVGVEETDKGDHYDPMAKMVRLSRGYYHGKSLCAIAVAAHEVGHAIQHQQKHPLFDTRTRLAIMAQWTERLGSVAMLGIPVIAAITRAPSAALLTFIAGFASIFVSTLVHLITLPVEIDASFGRALPILQKGNHIREQDEAAVRRVLKAAAFTYVASSLASLLSLARWIAVLRRR